MTDTADLDHVRCGVDEEDAVVANAKAYLFGIPLQGFHVPGAGFDEAVKCVEDSQRGGLVKDTDVSLGLIRPDALLQAGSW